MAFVWLKNKHYVDTFFCASIRIRLLFLKQEKSIRSNCICITNVDQLSSLTRLVNCANVRKTQSIPFSNELHTYIYSTGWARNRWIYCICVTYYHLHSKRTVLNAIYLRCKNQHSIPYASCHVCFLEKRTCHLHYLCARNRRAFCCAMLDRLMDALIRHRMNMNMIHFGPPPLQPLRCHVGNANNNIE